MQVTEVREHGMEAQCALVTKALWRRLAGDVQAAAESEALAVALERQGRLDVFEEAVAHVHAEVRSSVARAICSPEMRRKRLLHEILHVIVDHTLATGEPLKQVAIAIHVYGEKVAGAQGQGAVASEIARLRKTLDAYYKGSGAADSIRLHIACGRRRQLAIVTRRTNDSFPVADPAASSLVVLTSHFLQLPAVQLAL